MSIVPFRSGIVQLVRCPVLSATVIEPGDLVWLDSGNAKPASDFAWTTDLATTRGNFAAKFLGLAHTGSEDGETEPISVDVSPFAVYECEAAALNYRVGDPLAPAETVSALSNRQLEQVANVAHAIARSAEATAALATNVRACFASAYHAGSANVNAAIG